MDELITGTFHDTDDANAAIDELLRIGYARESINVIMSHETRARYHAHDAPGESQGANIAKGAAGGGAIGGTLGALIAGGLAATGGVVATIVSGGVALPFVVGPVAAALVGAGAGAAGGSVLGAALGAAVPAAKVERVERDVNDGAIVIGVHADATHDSAAREILRDAV